jgi:hypothetical protein
MKRQDFIALFEDKNAIIGLVQLFHGMLERVF